MINILAESESRRVDNAIALLTESDELICPSARNNAPIIPTTINIAAVVLIAPFTIPDTEESSAKTPTNAEIAAIAVTRFSGVYPSITDKIPSTSFDKSREPTSTNSGIL